MTWKLFEMLLCKQHSHVAHNLVLRNVASHSHVDPTSSVRDSPTARDAIAAEANCIDSAAVTTRTDEVAGSSHVPSPSNLPAPRKPFFKNCDALAHGDSGVSPNDILSSSSLPVSDTVLGSSEVHATSSLYREDESHPSRTETDKTSVMDTAAGGDVGGVHSHVLSKSQPAFKTQAAASLLASAEISQTLVEYGEIPIQQVVYT